MILVYQIKVGLCLIAFYLLFKLLLCHDTLHRFNRLLLLSLVVLSLLLPCLRMGVEEPTAVSEGLVAIEYLLAVPMLDAESKEVTSLSPAFCAYLVYYIGIATVLLWNLLSFWRLHRLLNRAVKIVKEADATIYVMAGELAPFSYWHRIVISEKDYREHPEEILIHEKAHIHLLHWADVVLMNVLTIVQWWNPAAWLLRRELQQIHEYEADEAVLKRGVDAQQYQLLLIRKSVGDQLFSMANNLNHQSLKKRIHMMTTRKTAGWQRLKLLTILPVAALAVVTFAHPNVEEVAAQIEAADPLPHVTAPSVPVADTLAWVCVTHARSQIVERKVHESKPAAKVVAEADTIVKEDAKGVFDVVEQMPQFPGGASELMRYLSMNIKYPEEAHQAGVMGRVIVTFVVEKDGSISEPTVIRSIHSSLDAEALRVVSAMPKWEPGMQNGEPVRVKYTVPITFSLKGSDNSAEDYKTAYDVVKNTAPDFSMQNVKILVDGKPVKNLTIVSTDNVTGIQILKDAESLAKYDAKDKYAVVLVTSKHVDTQQE